MDDHKFAPPQSQSSKRPTYNFFSDPDEHHIVSRRKQIPPARDARRGRAGPQITSRRRPPIRSGLRPRGRPARESQHFADAGRHSPSNIPIQSSKQRAPRAREGEARPAARRLPLHTGGGSRGHHVHVRRLRSSSPSRQWQWHGAVKLASTSGASVPGTYGAPSLCVGFHGDLDRVGRAGRQGRARGGLDCRQSGRCMQCNATRSSDPEMEHRRCDLCDAALHACGGSHLLMRRRIVRRPGLRGSG